MPTAELCMAKYGGCSKTQLHLGWAGMAYIQKSGDLHRILTSTFVPSILHI